MYLAAALLFCVDANNSANCATDNADYNGNQSAVAEAEGHRKNHTQKPEQNRIHKSAQGSENQTLAIEAASRQKAAKANSKGGYCIDRDGKNSVRNWVEGGKQR